MTQVVRTDMVPKAWQGPDGKIYDFSDLTLMFYPGTDHEALRVEGCFMDGEGFVAEFKIPEDLPLWEANDAVAAWGRYCSEKEEQHAAPDPEEEAEPEAEDPDEDDTVDVSDILADLVGQLQRQNVNLANLVDRLSPKVQDPLLVEVAEFDFMIADRAPTQEESASYVAGVSFTLAYLEIDDHKCVDLFSTMGIPSVMCNGCDCPVPAQRALRDTTNRVFYGIDCCGKDKEYLRKAHKEATKNKA